ncbi:MAG TPA: DUF4252 domain-containing protein [Puia sp.]|nr:DUF4252 domain-containing protein [Puia sp.]
MQKLFFPLALIITLSACSSANSQSQDQRSSRDGSPSLDKFYDRFCSENKDGNSLSIDPGFLLNASFSGKESNSGWMHKITKVRLLLLDDKKTPAREQEWRELSQSLQKDQFEELLTIRQGKDRVQLLSKERGDGQKEVVFLAGGKDGGGLFIHFRGHFTAADMEKIQSALQDTHHSDSQEQ